MGELRMPSLGADMEAGTLVEWHIEPGARVKRGDVVALVETQKGIVEIEIWESGVVREILVQPGAKVPVGTVLATVDDAAGPPPPAKPAAEKTAPKSNGPSAPITIIQSPAPSRAPSVRASPAARQLAREHEIDLAKIRGTGPHDAVTRDDVAKAISPAAPTPSALPKTPGAIAPSPSALSGMRSAIAAAMARSKREIPHYYLSAEIDVACAVAWLGEENARRPVTERILFAALLLKATALALREVPELNGFYVDGKHEVSKDIHLGVAISLRQGGLVAPAIHRTDEKSLVEIMARLSDLVKRARTGSLRSSELADPTITVTNLGDEGTDVVFGVIYPPQVAIVGFGAVRERPWADAGMLGVRPIVNVSVAADHRVSDGHRGARFLSAVARALRTPEKL